MADTTRRPQPAFRTREPMVGYVVAVFLSSATLGMAYSIGITPDTVGAFVSGQVGFWLGLLFAIWLASKVSGTGSIRADYRLTTTAHDALLGTAVGAFLQLVILPILYLPIGVFVDDMDVARESRDLLDQPGWTWLLVVGVVLIAPVVEELFFRGLLLGALTTRFGTAPAVGLSALLFAATHFQLLQLPGLLVAGLGFAAMRVRSGAVGPAIAAHMAFNTATLLVMWA